MVMSGSMYVPPSMLGLEAPPPRTEPSGRVVSDGGLAALAADPRHLVLRYEPRSRRLVVLHP